MGDTIEKTVIHYGNIMALCLVEASRIISSYGDAPELCRQITHDLFMAVNSESRKSAELEVIGKLKEVADSFKKDDDQLPLQGIIMTPGGPMLMGRPYGRGEDRENGEDPILPRPPKIEENGE